MKTETRLSLKVERAWFITRVRLVSLFTRFRFGHYFASFGKGTLFYGLPEFDPDFQSDLRISLGRQIVIGPRVGFRGRGSLEIGDRSSIGSGVIFGLTSRITIGKEVLVADNVSFRTADHEFQARDIPIVRQGERSAPIVIEDDVWIGANAVILRNVNIGYGAIVAANAVVTESVESFSVVGGVPARVIGKR